MSGLSSGIFFFFQIFNIFIFGASILLLFCVFSGGDTYGFCKAPDKICIVGEAGTVAYFRNTQIGIQESTGIGDAAVQKVVA